jgi:hypothetical protein
VASVRRALGALVGSIGGLIFVLVNAGGVATGVRWPVRVAGLVIFALVVWIAVVRSWDERAAGPRSRTALRTYGICVTAMVLAIPLGSLVLRQVGQPGLVLPWVVVVVGAHFLPMGRVFTAPVFLSLGLTLVGIGVLGGLLALAHTNAWVPWTGIAAGLAVLAASASGARASHRVV